ncbi:Transmembrane and TPR repeat-containing protein 2 [Blattella germanica]|nr:Transmembrane and TPR repeat-containing protein 2 [Blattella germanica]
MRSRGMDWATIVSSIIAFALYYNTWDSGFVYDDNRAILSNDDVQPHTPLLDLLRHDFWGTPLEHSGSHGSYRPLAVLSFRLNVVLAGGRLSARGFHVFNTLLHAATSAAFTRWVHVLTPHRLTPWISGILFAVHPIHTEAVAGVVGRADVGAALFFMLSLLSYHEHAARGCFKYLAACVLLGTCAMFTKEQGITVFAICIVYELVAHSSCGPLNILKALFGKSLKKMPKEKQQIRSIMVLLTSTILLVTLRTWLTGGNFPTFALADNPASRCDSFITRTLTFLYLPVFNFGLLLCPSTLSFDWSMDSIPLVNSFYDQRNLASALFYSALIWYIYKSVVCLSVVLHQQKQELSTDKSAMSTVDVNSNICCKKHPQRHSSNSTKPTNFICNHLLSALHTCFSCLSVLNSGNSTVHKNKNVYKLLCQCTYYQSKQNFSAIRPNVFSREVYKRKQDCVVVLLSVSVLIISFIPASNLVAYVGFVVAERILYIPSLGFCLLVGHGTTVIIEKLLERSTRNRNVKAILLCTVLSLLMIAFGVKTYLRNLDWKSEESLYRSGITINPAKAYGNLGNILSMKGQYEEAEACYRKALEFRPNMADVHYNLGVLLQSHQRFDEAIHRYHVAIQCRPRLAVAHLNLGLVLARVGRTSEAKLVLRRCAGLDGKGLRDIKTHQAARVACLFHIGRLAMDQGRLNEAIDVFLEAVHNRPHYYAPQSLFNMLGEAYSRQGRDAEAEPWFRAALSTRPDHIPAHLTYGKLLARNRTRLAEAEDWYIRAERLAPGDPAVFRHYGQFLLSQKRYGEAVAKFENAMALSSAPEYEDLVSTATSLRLAGDFGGAEKYYKLAISIRPQEASSLANLGALYHLIGKLEEAEMYYQRTLRLLPEDEVTKTNLQRLRNLKRTRHEMKKLQGKS